jgi:hypothetical protein
MSKKSTKKTGSKSKGTKAAKPKAERKSATEAKPKRVSALDAAATVPKAKGDAMRSGELIAAMAEQGLWSSPNGKTPHATLYAAIPARDRGQGEGGAVPENRTRQVHVQQIARLCPNQFSQRRRCRRCLSSDAVIARPPKRTSSLTTRPR